MYYFLCGLSIIILINYNSIYEWYLYDTVYLYQKDPIVINSINKQNILKIISSVENYDDEEDEITFLINSNGGDVYYGHKLIEVMENFKNENFIFNCYAIRACSMAFDIFQHCNNRFVTPHTYLMQHNATININYSMSELQEALDYGYFNKIIDINNKLDLYSSNKINMNYTHYKKLIENDLVLNNGAKIINLNVADTIVRILDLFMFEL